MNCGMNDCGSAGRDYNVCHLVERKCCVVVTIECV